MQFIIEKVKRGLYVVKDAYKQKEDYFSTGVKNRRREMPYISLEDYEALQTDIKTLRRNFDAGHPHVTKVTKLLVELHQVARKVLSEWHHFAAHDDGDRGWIELGDELEKVVTKVDAYNREILDSELK